ncbi:MAG: helix-turn-helix domain-containing protein [Actinomycetaceae bacterium]|nr:helix-turn-helix domain-containing protein [Actinomycetaceae bacterium]
MRIAVHAFEGMSLFHLASTLLVFGEVTRLGLARDWTCRVWTANGAPVRTAEGGVFDEVWGPQWAARADLVVLPSWPGDLPEPGEDLRRVVLSAHRRGGAIAGLCLGAFPLAATGLLDGRSATTHWLHAESLASRYPKVQVMANALYVDHGDVLTSAGTAAALDACLHIVRKKIGVEAASSIARRAVIAPHRDGDQAQYVDRPMPAYRPEGVGATVQWALANLDQPLSVHDLAAHAHMSVRNFSRLFVEATGITPARWVLLKRLDEARRLLETRPWSIERIAHTCGFASAVTFRQNFVAQYSIAPTAYRARFAG